MRPLMTRLQQWSTGLFARLALTIFIGLLAVQGTSLWLQTSERQQALNRLRGQNIAERIAEIVRLLEAVPASERAGNMRALQDSTLRLAPVATSEVYPNRPFGFMPALLEERLGSAREMRTATSAPQHDALQRHFDIRLKDGQWIRFTASAEEPASALPLPLLLSLGLSVLIVLAVVMLAVRQLSQPMRRLADAADALGRDLESPPLAEHEGSTETRRAAIAFNRMQARLRHLLDERARALAAVSHDLRTPLTRLRLRAEMIAEDELREQFAADLEAMRAMLDTTLDYLRSLKDSETPCRIDIDGLLASLAADAAALGREVSISGRSLAPFSGRLIALNRALQNLVDNAIKYGERAAIVIEDTPLTLTLHIDDAGPGIPEAELTRVTEPYYRLDPARNSSTGGTGLGLSIVRDIVALHGGGLQLANRPEGGLRATLTLPRI